MQTARPNNLIDVDSLIKDFCNKHKQGIITLHNVYLHDNNEVSARALLVELQEELKTGCVTFINKNDEMDELDSYLFYIANDFYKKKVKSQVKKLTEYLCPSCLFLGKETRILYVNKLFRCDDCETELKSATDPKRIAFFRVFFKHNKNGYHCEDCDRFIPHPLDDSPIVSCPYYDCCFVGSTSSLKRMHHPNLQSNAEMLTLDGSKKGQSFKDVIPDFAIDAQSQLEVQEVLDTKVKLLSDIIESQSSSIPYNSSDFTIKHKHLTYQAFSILLKKYPFDMVEYLLHGSRSGGFQNKAFQEYIRLLEESLPFTFKKNKKSYKVESLLDDNLNLFDGISTFEAIVNDKLGIKNNTKEFYIGGRKAAYTKPFYIGKLLSVVNKSTKNSLMENVIEYSFSKIKMKNVTPGTEVIVTHLRVPPHYQMGGMVYINRIRKKIVDRANMILNQKSDDVF